MSDLKINIGEYVITEADIDGFISSLPQEQQMYRSIPQFRSQVKDKLVEMTLFAVYGEEAGMKETDTYKESIKLANRDILGQIAVNELLGDIDVTEEEMKDYFEANKTQFAKGPEASAKHILVDDEEKANSIKAEIEAGDKSFEDAAAEYSSCPSAKKGGSLGTFGRGQMVPEFDNAVFTGEVKTILGPVKTQFGYHLIWIDSRTEGDEPVYDDVKNDIKKTVIELKQMKAYDEKVSELKAKYIK